MKINRFTIYMLNFIGIVDSAAMIVQQVCDLFKINLIKDITPSSR